MKRKFRSRTQVFNKELSLIQDNLLRSFARQTLLYLPKTFWTVPASSTGKYHPEWANEKGGLVTHTRKAVEYFVSMHPDFIKANPGYDAEQTLDCGIVALIFHDAFKYGYSGNNTYTCKNHAHYAAAWYQLMGNTYQEQLDLSINFLRKTETISGLIRTHMGPYDPMEYTAQKMSPLQMLVHQADLLASRTTASLPQG